MITTPGGDVTIQLPAEKPNTAAKPKFFSGTGEISLSGAFTMSSDIALTTIPGLQVRNDGFRLCEVSRKFAGTKLFGSIMTVTGVAVGM